MGQLKMKNILDYVEHLRAEGMSQEDIEKMPVYIGQDDEFNGAHMGWYIQSVDPEKEEDKSFVEIINQDCCNRPIECKSVLIS